MSNIFLGPPDFSKIMVDFLFVKIDAQGWRKDETD
jgi:hypothetical protein